MSGNSTAGDGAYGGGIAAGDSVNIVSSMVSGNSTAGEEADGGGIAAFGSVNIVSSTVSGNSTTGYYAVGGGISAGYIIDIVSSTVSGNSTTGSYSYGGAMHAFQFVRLADSTVSDNRTEGDSADGGRRVFSLQNRDLQQHARWQRNARQLRIRGCRLFTLYRDCRLYIVEQSHVEGSYSIGGAITGSEIYVLSSSLIGNATSGDGAAGGGIFAGYGSGGLTLVNSTLSGNSTAGENAPGGGAYAAARLEGVLITVTGNSVAGPITPPVGVGDAGGGGLALGPSADARLILANSIVLGNAATDPSASADEIGGGAVPQPARVFFEGLNIVGADPADFDPTPANPYVGGGADAVINADPATVFATPVETHADADGDSTPEAPTGVTGGAVADNGGARASVALDGGAANPALDSADPGIALALSELSLDADLNGDGDRLDLIASVDALATDSRGAFFPRALDQPASAGSGIDLGAFELGLPSFLALMPVDVDGDEGDAGATAFIFEVTRTNGLGHAMTVDFVVTGSGADPATAEDFAGGAVPQGTLDFAPGETVVPLTVEVAGDTDVEPDQRFTVALSNPQGNPLGASTNGSRVGIIRNDDIPLVGNTPPVARDDIAATPEGMAVTIDVLANDSDAESDPLQIVAIGNRPDLGGPPGFGTVTQSGDTLIYEPEPGFRGTDIFSYEISDGNGGLAAARVDVVVEITIGNPARGDTAETSTGVAVLIDVLANDGDPGDTISVTEAGAAAGRAPESGTVAVEGAQIRYTPDPGFAGIDIFAYTVADGAGGTDSALVSVRVGSPALPAGVTRGTPGDDKLLIGQNSAYVGVGGADSFLFSPAAEANAISLIDGAPGDVLQLTEGLALAGFEIRPDALLLDLETGAQLRLSQASLIDFEVGANPTTEDPGALTDFAGFAQQVLGTAVPATGSLTGGPLIVEEALIA